MGFLSGLLPIAGSVVGNMIAPGIGGAVGGLLGGAVAGGSGSQQTGAISSVDPRAQSMLWGSPGNQGLLDRYKGLLDQPQNAGTANYGNLLGGYLAGNSASDDFNHLRAEAYHQIDGGPAAPTMQGAQIKAPAQNAMDLSGSFGSLINGQPGANPYLTAGIQGGINQSQNQFNQMQRQATDNLQRNVLGGIRSNSVLAGQYGGSRQGVAEGNAISDFTQQQQDAIAQFGQNNTNAATGAHLSAYNSDRDRQLAATMGLSGQQYGVAQQNAGFQQGADQTNIGALLNSNALSAGIQQNGVSNLNGLMGNAYNVAQNQDNHALNQASRVNGLLAPYLGAGQVKPIFQDQAGGAMGGALSGLGIANGLFGGGSSSRFGGALQTNGSASSYDYTPQTLPTSGLLGNFRF